MAIVGPDDLSKSDRAELRSLFMGHIFPILTPIAADPAHPFPFILNKGLTLAVSLEREDEDPEYDGRLLDTAERPDAYVLRQELAGMIQIAIEKLPLDQRTTLVLSDIEGFNYQEIAEATGVALGTVKSRLSRGRARLRDILLEQEELLPARYRLSKR